MARGSAGESVLHRHLRVLESFDAWHPFLTLTEIAEAAGIPPSSAHRLIAELEREGLLERLPDRTYRLGVRLANSHSRTPSRYVRSGSRSSRPSRSSSAMSRCALERGTPAASAISLSVRNGCHASKLSSTRRWRCRTDSPADPRATASSSMTPPC